jgi:hypothetical protein
MSGESVTPGDLMRRAVDQDRGLLSESSKVSVQDLKTVTDLYLVALDACFTAAKAETNEQNRMKLRDLARSNIDRAEQLRDQIKVLEESSLPKGDTHNYFTGSVSGSSSNISNSWFTLPP